ncbi:MAG: methylenetetrahydrofolate reductase [NAD(P)H] [Candidatus Mycalebacterium zealandia]|nr:MAG: methylenetetrahydrofolate reductase [NAD(P)H] [Candidatus Mycalebacterium zealandia]
MTFPELYRNPSKPVISFEIFPPKTPEGKGNLLSSLEVLAKLSPGFISVTYGAMGSTRGNSFEIASHIKDKLKIETASHLTCVGSSSAEIDLILKNLRERGIENIVALRGDPPDNRKKFTTAHGGYSHANELVEHIRGFESENRNGRFGVAVAGYPEKHIEAPSLEKDIENLAKKIHAGADTIITQLFYDNRFYFDYVKKVRRAGLENPVIPGLMPILSMRQVLKITSMCGTTVPESIMKRLEECERKNGDIGQVAIDICAEQAENLLSEGVPGIHFYVLNRASYVKSVLKRLGL